LFLQTGYKRELKIQRKKSRQCFTYA
jgi:hypothetical protein